MYQTSKPSTAPSSIFVYGTLKPGERAYKSLCEAHVVKTQQAMTPGRIYALPQGYPAMTQEAGWVYGYLLVFNGLAPLSAIDEFEDYYPDCPERSLYRRQEIPVFSLTAKPIGRAWGYVMELSQVHVLGGYPLASGSWREG